MESRKKTKPVYWVGVNDAGYHVHAYDVIDGKRKRVWMCSFYQAWMDMLARCYSVKFQARNPTYSGCSVAYEWHSFSAFRAWMFSQDWEGKQLDKDLLIPGNKVYSPDACVFVSRQLNSFTLDGAAARGEWPIGVYWNKQSGKFMSRCSNPFAGKHEFLGLFTDPDAAHEAWRARKHEHACTYADMQTDPRIAEALRARYATKGETK